MCTGWVAKEINYLTSTDDSKRNCTSSRKDKERVKKNKEST